MLLLLLLTERSLRWLLRAPLRDPLCAIELLGQLP
jgi:hypothetical protein